MNDSVVGALGNVLIAAGAVSLAAAGFKGMDVGVAVIGAALFVGGCLLRVESAILHGQHPTPAPRPEAALAWRRPDSEELHLPQRADRARPWNERQEHDGSDPTR